MTKVISLTEVRKKKQTKPLPPLPPANATALKAA